MSGGGPGTSSVPTPPPPPAKRPERGDMLTAQDIKIGQGPDTSGDSVTKKGKRALSMPTPGVGLAV